MNDTRFKELLNLHLDHRLSSGEARELEHLLQQNPALRRTFRGYAVMQRGCAELFRRSASDAPAPDSLVRALRDAEIRMTDKARSREWIRNWTTWGATAGVAALVALVVARVSQPTIPTDASPDEFTLAALPGGAAALEMALKPATPSASARLVVRQSLPAHLTLAALGIEPAPAEANSLSRWQITEEQLARLDNASGQLASWMSGSQSVESSDWNAATASAIQFGARPISAWGGQGLGAQVQSASYTFER